MNLEASFSPDAITLSAKNERAGLLHRLVRRSVKSDLQNLSPNERSLAFAIADLRAAADTLGEQLSIDSDRIVLSHRIAASVTGETGAVLGLPPLVEMTLKTDAEGIVGSSGFRLRYEWSRNGQRQMPRRTGAILETANGLRRIPMWMMDAIAIADAYRPDGNDAADWEALGRFRKALDPGAVSGASDEASRISMTDFLSGLEVRLVDRFSLSPKGETDFDVVPFSGDTLEVHGSASEAAEVSESMSEVQGLDLQRFQTLVRGRGALPAYRLSPGRYVVVEQSASPALAVMAEMQKAAPEERRAFIRNPLPRVTEAMEAQLRSSGQLDGLSPQAEQEAIEAAVGPVLVETREFSERVTGVVKYEKPGLGEFEDSGTSWLPEDFSARLIDILDRQGTAELQTLRERVQEAIEAGRPTVDFEDLEVPARPEMLQLIDERMVSGDADDGGEDEAKPEKVGPFVLDTEVNYDDLKWLAKLRPRMSELPDTLPEGIRTPLKGHQKESFSWQVGAWRAGLPGVLNADEQGLGKTLQTISFLAWLKEVIARPQAQSRGPVLVVAPTSLLENWEQEVARHMHEPGLGHLIRLYGSSIGGRKLTGAKGKDTDDGEAKLDLGALHEAVAEGRAHRYWLLTTYTTLTNYQHSLARIPFSAVVFDEIQALKNPVSLRAVAARSINADFRIGLTGTPIENATVDLWAIMDQLAPGSLDSLKDFRQRYAKPEEDNMAELHGRVFLPRGGTPPLAVRRLKETVATDLPAKSRRIHPRLMPDVQALAYDDARLKLARGGMGAQLKMLHHIRSVSVHPALEIKASNDEFVVSSARLQAAMDILNRIKANGERALVFIEHRQMQYRFIELVRSELGLPRVDLINGDTPIPQRQAIVNRFQRHLDDDQGFDLLVLGPKAAGTGLTLTAATHVIHLSRWWNPAVEEQCNDRVHRIGQTRPVTVHLPMAIHEGYREQSFDCLLQSLMMRKRRLASSALWPMGDVDDDVAGLQKGMASERLGMEADPLGKTMAAMFARDELELPPREADGSYPIH
ncbi:DEAD/DEAH box helicase [Shinella kummerowiae]|uniref:DEAD/DEAH box helicase n=1 Tax=Shinella kummerowiae TaxID=417745 RepID=UPI0021B65715|nr:DEAD/DEAH box helicase [Shinella kummerowiae]MCT7662927.1 DEAD/DEAH box helicase [Shinella kummerowiae]